MIDMGMKKMTNTSMKEVRQNTKKINRFILLLLICVTIVLGSCYYIFHEEKNKKTDILERKLSENTNFQVIYQKYNSIIGKEISSHYGGSYIVNNLYVRDDLLYESGGQFKQSQLLQRSLDNFVSLPSQNEKLQDDYFGEGADFFKDENGKVFIYQLTWKARKILEWQNNQIIREIKLPDQIKEGWGLTHDPSKPNIFYITDGTNNIYETDRNQDFKVLKTHTVSQKDSLQQLAC